MAMEENISDENHEMRKSLEKPLESADSTTLTDSPPGASTCLTTPKVRHDWYQTQTHIVVTILAKGVKSDDVSVTYGIRELKASVKLSSGEDYVLHLHLSHDVAPDECHTRIFASKIELKLKKQDGHHWTKLEGDEGDVGVIKNRPVVASSNKKPTDYPSSNKAARDWDKIVHNINEEEKKEEPEGDEALNNLFQKIYADGSDETRKAMNKSFAESGGTVLSTNWSEIGSKKTEIKPPDGMEYKRWDQ